MAVHGLTELPDVIKNRFHLLYGCNAKSSICINEGDQLQVRPAGTVLVASSDQTRVHDTTIIRSADL